MCAQVRDRRSERSRTGWTRLHLLCFLPLVAFLVVLDVWRINGRVLDEQSGLPVAGARVLITIKEEGRRGIVPHTGRSGAECIRSFVETTDSNGRFSLTQFGFSFTWGQRRASFDTYVDGWYQVSTKRSSVGAFVLSPSTDVNVLLRRNSGQRWSFVHDGNELRLPQMNPLRSFRRLCQRNHTQSRSAFISNLQPPRLAAVIGGACRCRKGSPHCGRTIVRPASLRGNAQASGLS